MAHDYGNGLSKELTKEKGVLGVPLTGTSWTLVQDRNWSALDKAWNQSVKDK